MALNEAHKARIIAHMNKDHADELSHYLRAFNGVPEPAARGAALTDMTADAMTVRGADGVRHAVAIAPPLASAADARPRLVDMSQRARKLLGLDEEDAVRISTYTPPEGAGVVSSVGVSLYFVCAATLSLVRPGTAAWAALDAFFPYGAPGYRWLVRAIFVPVLVIHVTEAYWMARTRLAAHGVAVGSALWLLWMANAFIEGYPAMRRFDGLVEAERRRKMESAKH
ncbi:hypothetical protein GGR52DRAFT_572911 [Hypoxylon sp. FL1284]|nr:hypothetical protein GGR52DRAFT_572911 [Hypoxylon sp. FL1284]